jgi:hypothetical protein
MCLVAGQGKRALFVGALEVETSFDTKQERNDYDDIRKTYINNTTTNEFLLRSLTENQLPCD